MKKIKLAILMLIILTLVCGCATTAPAPTPQNPDTPPTPTPGQTEQNGQPEVNADNALLDENAKANTAVLPRSVASGSELVTAAKGSYTLYFAAENDLFAYNDGKEIVDESMWFDRLGKEYGIKINAVRKSAATVLSAERLALLSGKQMDLMSFAANQMPYAVGMTESLDAFFPAEKVAGFNFLNTALLTYGGQGTRFVAPAGVARCLWYVTDENTKTTPLTMAQNGSWNYTAFAAFVAAGTKENEKFGCEIRDYTDLFAALGTPIVSFDGKFANGFDAAKPTLAALQKISKTSLYDGAATENVPTLDNGKLSMRYGQTPFVTAAAKYPKFSWAPLPCSDAAEDNGVVSACTPVLALPKGSKNAGAVNAALLWAARYADANHDMLRFDYGMSFADWSSYYNATREQIQVVPSLGDLPQKLKALVATPDEAAQTEFAAAVAADVAVNNERLIA